MIKELKVKLIGAAVALTALGAWAAQSDDVRSVAPALEKYTQERLLGEVWSALGFPREIEASSRSLSWSRATRRLKCRTT
jgi:hypothetical protein